MHVQTPCNSIFDTVVPLKPLGESVPVHVGTSACETSDCNIAAHSITMESVPVESMPLGCSTSLPVGTSACVLSACVTGVPPLLLQKL